MANSKASYWLTSDGLTLLEGWARDGLTDEQIANNMGINPSTLYDYKKRYPEISESLKKGKEIIDYEVENSLIKIMQGYTVEVNKQKVTRDGDVVNCLEEIYYPPNVTAIIFWLKNRNPKKWREKPQEQSNNESTKKVVIVDDLPKCE